MAEVDGGRTAVAPGAVIPTRPAVPAAAPAAPPLRRHRRWLYRLVVVLLLGQMAAALVTAARQQTPTTDEPVYVGAAAVYLRERSFRVNPEHPPVGKLVIAAGLAFADPQVPVGFTGDQGALGRQVLYGPGADPWRLMLAARLPVIVLTLLFGLVVLAFARDVAGPVGGLVALALYAFSPDVIAHGSLATLDVAAAGFLLTAAWLLWRGRRRPAWYLPLAGVALGAAVATRMSALPAVPVLLLLAALSVRHARRRGAGGSPTAGVAPWFTTRARAAGSFAPRAGAVRRLAVTAGAAAGVLMVGVVVVWAAYLGVDPRLRWAPPADLPVISGLRGWLVDRLPFPLPYRDGVRIQFGMERATFGGFLFGRPYLGSRWYYLPAALAVKTPLGMLVLWLAGVVALVAVRRLRPAALYLLLPAAVLLAVALTDARNFGVRYVIFLPMFLAVAAAAVVTVRRRWVHVATATLVLFVAISSVRAYPYYLPYGNEAFGGPAQTHRHLHDSNVDWGQDLGRLADRLRQRYPGERVWLVYKGGGVPAHYGIAATDPRGVPPAQVRGLLVVSNSALARADAPLRALVAGGQRIDHVGHSMTIYRR